VLWTSCRSFLLLKRTPTKNECFSSFQHLNLPCLTSSKRMVYRRVLFGVAVCMAASSVGASYESVTGKELEKCSMPGMALTGYTRQGKCVAHDDDAGSHHVCIDMASNTGGNFCSVTGQPDWSVCQN
jgi:hypothetical protein